LRSVELSNHPGTMLERERGRLEREWERREWENERRFAEERARVEQHNEEARSAYEAELAQHGESIERLREERDAVRAKRRWGKWVRGGLRLSMAKRNAPRPPLPLPKPAPPPRLQPTSTGQTAKLTAGMQSEQDVADSLSGALGDEWVMLRGYRNRRGEIDQLLLGPAGLIAIEIKYRNATVYCSDDKWRFEKYDRYGNRVEDGWIEDRKGRSPSQQLGEPTVQLEEFLASRGQPTTFRRVVLLTHPNSKLGSFESESMTVDVATYAGYVLELIDESDAALEPGRLDEIERLIVQDHAYHEKQPPRRGPRP